jgi:putative membrane protein
MNGRVDGIVMRRACFAGHATRQRSRDSDSLAKRRLEQGARSGAYSMKATTKMMFCLMLGCVTMVIPNRAKAESDDDKKFLATAAQGDQNEIKLSELAVEKATNPAVKAFAEKMVTEHKEMTEGMKPFAESWGLTAPTGPDDDHQKEWDKLNGMSGADFDKEYISQMVSDHAKALDAFTKEAKDTKDAKFQAVVLKDKTMVAAHKNMAYDLKKKL